jgi:hypothetical protein
MLVYLYVVTYAIPESPSQKTLHVAAGDLKSLIETVEKTVPRCHGGRRPSRPAGGRLSVDQGQDGLAAYRASHRLSLVALPKSSAILLASVFAGCRYGLHRSGTAASSSACFPPPLQTCIEIPIMAAIVHRLPVPTAVMIVLVVNGLISRGDQPSSKVAAAWKLGLPIVAYWASPPLNDKLANQMAEGGWNLVWCHNQQELDIAARHGLRAQFHHGLISPKSLDDPARRAKLDALVQVVRKHPALYSYFIVDEPNAAQFSQLGRLVAYLRERDPAHLAYINLFPTYATNEQLGTKGDAETAYREHLRQYIHQVKPSLLSYDHYQFMVAGDRPDYFLNLGMARQAAIEAHIPFLNIVQAASWDPSVRIPTGDEMRYLVYTTLAYGAKAISYYVYCLPRHNGGICLPDGTPTPLYHALKPLNHEFLAIARELQPLRSLAVYHAGMLPEGTTPLPADAPFRLDPPVASTPHRELIPVSGILLGFFGLATTGSQQAEPTHVVVVNLDYHTDTKRTLVGLEGARLEVFDASNHQWIPAGGSCAVLELPRGGGKLVRVHR